MSVQCGEENLVIFATVLVLRHCTTLSWMVLHPINKLVIPIIIPKKKKKKKKKKKLEMTACISCTIKV